MEISIKVQDRLGTQPAVDTVVLAWRNGVPITASRIIAERIRLEWDARQSGLAGGRRKSDFGQWVSPGAASSPEDAIASAIKAFRSQGFALVVDGSRLDRPSDEVVLRPGSSVTFLKLPA